MTNPTKQWQDDDFEDWDDDSNLYWECPSCHAEYDEIDHEFQICHLCGLDASKLAHTRHYRTNNNHLTKEI